MLLLVAIVLCTVGIQSSKATLDSIDLLDPIVRKSPVKGTKNDMFGLSFAVHQFFSDSSALTREEALEQTVILIGAPKGQFPGGVDGIPYNGLVCNNSLSDAELEALTDEYIKTCYESQTFGLIYNCSLTTDVCGGVLGNGDATGPDGLLFDRVGNTKLTDDGVSFQLQNKDDQLMGYTMYSSGEYFVACAPLWEYAGSGADTQPRGNCVYSNRTLTGFTIIRPCTTGNSNNQNDGGFCTTGMGVYISKNISSPFLAAGTPGYDRSRGGVYYYNNLDNPTQNQHDFTQDPYIELTDDNTYTDQSTYFGYYITSGFITSQTHEDFIVTSPRFDEYSQLGRIHIVSDGTMLPVMNISGEQLGEYFGNSAAAMDLNGDGWDDVVVGAPIHSTESLVEVGKVYVYINNGSILTKSAELLGPVARGRFGYAVAALGDLNNDGYEDFAVSAPFEGSGVVYIYHGQAADDTGSIVNKQYQQRISAADLPSHVPDVSRFGFTLAGEVDVDINEYRDLVVGDYKSQLVFILRSRPVAAVNVSIVTDVDEVLLTNYDCVDSNNNPIACFNIEVCATYTGRGLADFSAPYQVEEVLSRNTRRLFFINNGTEETSSIGTIAFTGQNVASCRNITVYIKNGSDASGDISSFEVIASMQQIFRQQPPSMSYPSDFSQEPVITSTTGSAMVRITSTCGEDGLCTPDLVLNIINITYLDRSGAQHENQDNLVVGAIDRVDVYLSYSNNGEDAANAYLEFSLPNGVYEHQQVLPQNRFITCNNTTPNEDNANYRCPIQSRLTHSDGTFVIYLRWQVSSTLRGNQENVSINISLLTPTEFGLESNPADNSDVKVTSFIAQSRYFVSLISTSLNYIGNGVPNVDNRSSNLGQEFSITVDFANNGPSTIFDAVLDIYLPARAEETGDYYYIYPATLSTSSPLINCATDALNPEQYNITAATGKRRRRRSVRRHSRSILKSLSRTIRQSNTDDFNLDCMTDPSSCIKVTCMMDSIETQSFDVTIVSYVDERFFNGKTAEYHLNVYANSSINNNYTAVLPDSVTSNSFDIQLTLEGDTAETPFFPWYAIVPSIVAAIIIISPFVIVLYCLGWFRRRKKAEEKGGTGDDFEQFASNPFGQSQPQSIKPITDEEKNPDLKDKNY